MTKRRRPAINKEDINPDNQLSIARRVPYRYTKRWLHIPSLNHLVAVNPVARRHLRDSFKSKRPHGVPLPQTQPARLHCQLHARSLLRPGARTTTKKMQLSGLVFLLLGSAACFDVDIAPPKLGLRRLFRRPYRGPICVIEIVGAELVEVANSGTASSVYPVALPLPVGSWLRCHFGRAAASRTKSPVRGSDEAAGTREYAPTRRWPRLAQSLRPAIQGHAGSTCGVEARVGLWRYPG